jgi:hypothetical protein
MLFDLRVLLAACLATLIFAAAGLGLLAGLRSPFKSSSGYAAKDAPVFSGPGLPKSPQLPVAENKPEVTGTIQTHIMQAPAVPMPAEPAPSASKEIKPAPQAGAKNPSIATLIEEDKQTAKPAAKAAPAKKAAVKKKPRVHAKRAPQQPLSNNPFSAFTNNNNNTAPVR